MKQQLKYPKKTYEDFDFFAGDMDLDWKIEPKTKLITTRKNHVCVDCKSNIVKGDYALYCSGLDEEGFVRYYLCLECAEKELAYDEDLKERTADTMLVFKHNGDPFRDFLVDLNNSLGKYEMMLTVVDGRITLQPYDYDPYDNDCCTVELGKEISYCDMQRFLEEYDEESNEKEL